MFRKWLTKRTLTITAIVITSLLVLYFILPISIPLILSLLLALMIEPLVRMLERKIGSRKWSVTLIYSMILSAVLIFCYFFLTKLIEKMIEFAVDLPEKMNGLIKVWETIEARIAGVLPPSVMQTINIEVQDYLLQLRNNILHYFNVEKITLLVSSIPELVISGIVFLVALFLFMLEIPHMRAFFRRHMYDRTYKNVMFVWTRISTSVFGMIRAAFILSFITWIFTFVGLLFIAPKNALIISIIISIIDLLPIIGATGVTIPWAITAYLMGDHSTAIKLFLFSIFLLIQRKILEPKIVGRGVGLPPLSTLVSMYIGLKLFGFVGFFIGPIILMLIYTLFESGVVKTDFKV